MIELSAKAIVALHDHSNQSWHQPASQSAIEIAADPIATIDALTRLPITVPGNSFLSTVAAQHLANFRLWHVEDLARVRSASDRAIADAKRAIDRINQQRNDLAEELDAALLREAPPPTDGSVALHSETPGMMIDRLSILSLKLYHTREEIDRRDAPPGHAERNRGRLSVLEAQRGDLALCLDSLWHAILQGTRRFKVYRQLKMYNDPSLNPAVYNENRTQGTTV